MVAERLTKAELARCLPEVLDRVRSGERFAIEQDGEIIAEIIPLSAERGRSMRDFARKLAELPRLDDDFAADVESAGAILLPIKIPEWPD
jgi:antitoxin (DNA-binding transcriptional repressor) of toxin-antitoxin stability system